MDRKRDREYFFDGRPPYGGCNVETTAACQNPPRSAKFLPPGPKGFSAWTPHQLPIIQSITFKTMQLLEVFFQMLPRSLLLDPFQTANLSGTTFSRFRISNNITLQQLVAAYRKEIIDQLVVVEDCTIVHREKEPPGAKEARCELSATFLKARCCR
jgi:hypothetical protein